MVTSLLLIAFGTGPDAKQVLESVIRNYQDAKEFRAHLTHHNSSGLFPGDYEQDLVWNAPKTFTLKVTKASKADRTAPDYISDGKTVKSMRSGKLERSDSVEIPDNTSPGWEVSGGMAMSWLMKTQVGSFFLTPPPNFTVKYRFGDTKEWQGTPVSEIIGDFTMDGNPVPIHIFLNPSRTALVGLSTESPQLTGYMKYTKISIDGRSLK